MSDEDHEPDVDAPDLVHWSPRHGPTVGGPIKPIALPLSSLGLVAVAGVGVGAVAVGALAIGALAIGVLAIGDVRLGRCGSPGWRSTI